MDEPKTLRRRSLLAFLVPVVFAVLMMQPTQVGRLVPLDEPPVVRQVGRSDSGTAESLASLLESRWCVRTTEKPQTQDGNFTLTYADRSILLQADRQYLTVTGDSSATYQILGKPLYDEVLPLLDVPDDSSGEVSG